MPTSSKSTNTTVLMHQPRESFVMNSETIACSTLSQRDQRALLFHLLYAMDSFEYSVTLESIADNYTKGFDCYISPQDNVFVNALRVIEHRVEWDEEMRPLLDNWKLERLGVATRLIWRYALWELKYTTTDILIVINEAVELAKAFAEKDAYKFTNGVLDRWIKKNKPEIDLQALSEKKEVSA